MHIRLLGAQQGARWRGRLWLPKFSNVVSRPWHPGCPLHVPNSVNFAALRLRVAAIACDSTKAPIAAEIRARRARLARIGLWRQSRGCFAAAHRSSHRLVSGHICSTLAARGGDGEVVRACIIHLMAPCALSRCPIANPSTPSRRRPSPSTSSSATSASSVRRGVPNRVARRPRAGTNAMSATQATSAVRGTASSGRASLSMSGARRPCGLVACFLHIRRGVQATTDHGNRGRYRSPNNRVRRARHAPGESARAGEGV